MKNIIVEKTFEFSIKILDSYFYLQSKHHYKLAEQIVKSGTSIGANVVEAQVAQSLKDFISKLEIASKEARETDYWLSLFDREELLQPFEGYCFLKSEIGEIIKILNSIIISFKRKLKTH
ncbi:four helix bundle protein [Algoriphagus ornithinivorans]|uniref:Four helix bundle protein n=1 Tax=Algoriphagus ornithinivorans TaxID=226506 RepID=A0A1I5HHE6_9BACT|nr:four helix bundle protein [Algoriphagus ornithinivorans]SFO47702.1 four helix bundle protein [Algoriphagus ornithinivorans]